MPRDPATLTKLTVPGALSAVRRKRLFRRFEGAAPIIWVAAPPGAGKTMLAASYIASSKHPCLWYQVDASDADPATLFYYMGLAAAKIAPRRYRSLPLLSPEYLADFSGFARRFFRALFECLPADSLLVLDNYHELDEVPVFQDIWRHALAEIPSGIRLIVLSRTEPPPAFARSIANRQIHLICWEDLRLTLEETRSLVGQNFGEEAILRLHEQSGGWAAGVILLLRHFGIHGAESEALSMQSRQSVFNYFAEEILAAVPGPTRSLLIGTAFFPDFTVAMAEQAGGHTGAAEIFDDLCRQHYFIDRREQCGIAVYRYHDLFRGFLLNQAGQDAHSHRHNAARALIYCGRMADAVPLLLENGDCEASVGIILSQAQQLVAQGRWKTLSDWIDALPLGVTDNAPWLSFWRGTAELPISPVRGRAMIERAYKGFTTAGDITGQLLAVAKIMEAHFHEYADFSALGKWVEVLESLGGIHAAFPTIEIEARVLTGMLVAAGHRQPASPMGQIISDRLEALLQHDLEPNQKCMIIAFMLWHATWVGGFTHVRRINVYADHLLHEHLITPLNKIMLCSVRGHGEIFQGNGMGARDIFDHAEKTARYHGLDFARTCLLLPMQIYRHLVFGDLASAADSLQETEKQPFSGAMNASQVEFSRSWFALLRGDATLACEYARSANALAGQSGSYVARSCTHAAWALALSEAGHDTDAQKHLSMAQQVMEGCRTGVIPYQLLLVEAWLALRCNDRGRCHKLLGKAFAQGAANGYASALLWLPHMMSRLCAEALAEGIEPGYVCWLIRKRGLLPPTPDEERWPLPLEIRTLGTFEVLCGGQPIEFTRKMPKKPITLLKVLIALGGSDIPESRLIDALWPDTEADAADKALTVTLHRLRKLLGVADAIQVKGGKISLNPAVCRVDAFLFDSLVERANALVADGRTEKLPQLSKTAMLLYRGNFLEAEFDEAWAISMRERLRTKFIRHVAVMAERHCKTKQCETVLGYYQRGLDADNLIEKFYQELMRCHHCLGCNADGLAVYRHMKQTFSTMLGVTPSATSERLHQALRDD